jgi:hypothetical protein
MRMHNSSRDPVAAPGANTRYPATPHHTAALATQPSRAESRAVFAPASRPPGAVAVVATSETDLAGGIDTRVRITTSL